MMKLEWERSQKIQILTSIMQDLSNHYLSVEAAFEAIKHSLKIQEKYELGVKSVEIIFSSMIMNAFNAIKSRSLSPRKKRKLTTRFHKIRPKKESSE